MKYGINVLLWTIQLDESILPQLELLRRMGYDGIEAPLFNFDLDYAAWGRRLDDLGLARTAVTCRFAADNPISPDPAMRQLGIDNNRRAVDCAAALGCEVLAGPFYAALGEFTGAGPTRTEWQYAADGLQAVAEHAATVRLDLAIESLNRFEIYLLNSQADAVRMAHEVDHPNCRVMVDTFHSHIEEKDAPEAIRQTGKWLRHVHVSENDRSTPGSGQVHWPGVFDALHEIGYDDWLMVEAFGLAMPELVAATKIWRRMFQSEEQLARDALTFMRSQVESRRA
jgi:D-psicose/D-tagatose/L-ribulose 3-epimerase